MKNEKQCLTSDLMSLGFENVYWHQQKLFLIYLTKLRFVLKIDKKSSLVLFKGKIKIKE